MENVSISKKALFDLLKLREESDSVVESLELFGNKEFMESFNRSKEQIKKREFVDWNAL